VTLLYPNPVLEGCGYDYGYCGAEAVAKALHDLAEGHTKEEFFLVADHHSKGADVYEKISVICEWLPSPSFRFVENAMPSCALKGAPVLRDPIQISMAVAHLMGMLTRYSTQHGATIFRRKG